MTQLLSHSASLDDPDTFWAEAARAVAWDVAPTRAWDGDRGPHARWFADGRLNTAYNALDRHVEAGAGERLALVHDSPVTGTVAHRTYAELRHEVAAAAGLLRDLGVVAGDRVLLYLPMIPEAVVAMLACARLGAVHSVVFGGFAPRELALRIDDARPKVVVTASCGIEPGRVVDYLDLLDTALGLADHRPGHRVVVQRPQAPAPLREGDIEWGPAVAAASPADCVPVAATDPLYILYTSGTTGKPKGVVRDNGGHGVALTWSLRHVFGVEPGEVFWAASDIGWVVGHSYIVYAPLLSGATTVLYEGKPVGTPDAAAFWRVVERHGVHTMFTAPTAVRAIKREDPAGELPGRHDLSSLRALFLAGERTDPDTFAWATEHLGIPVVDNWWQTETGWPIAANCLGIERLPLKPGSPTRPVPGFDVRVVDENGRPVETGRLGSIVLGLPLPPGALLTLYQDDERYVRSYMSDRLGGYITGDEGYFDEEGYLFVLGRNDDVINVAGHRLSSGGIEEAVAAHPDVAECAVVGVADELKGQLPEAFVVLSADAPTDRAAEREAEIRALVRDRVGRIASIRGVHVVVRLPKTRSGKVLRKTLREITDGVPYTVPSTIEDPAVLDEIAQRLASEQSMSD